MSAYFELRQYAFGTSRWDACLCQSRDQLKRGSRVGTRRQQQTAALDRGINYAHLPTAVLRPPQPIFLSTVSCGLLAMTSRASRRSRALESDDEDSRANTPSSTAPNDSKRIRRSANVDLENDESSEEEYSQKASAALSIRNSQAARRSNGAGSSTGYQPGAIVRVKLTNFVTYTFAEFFPGPNLNMVIGPNGTGKSTLVCAICLGLGWSPKVQ